MKLYPIFLVLAQEELENVFCFGHSLLDLVWPTTHYVAEDGLGLLILLPSSPKGWNFKHALSFPVHVVVGIQPRASSRVGKYSTNRTPSTAKNWSCFFNKCLILNFTVLCFTFWFCVINNQIINSLISKQQKK